METKNKPVFHYHVFYDREISYEEWLSDKQQVLKAGRG